MEPYPNTTTGSAPTFKQLPLEIPELIILPENTRFYRNEKKRRHSFLVEVRPSIVNFNYNKHDWRERYDEYEQKSLGARTYKVAIPWQYFWIHVDNYTDSLYGPSYSWAGAHIFWAIEQIKDMNSEVFPAMLPNLCQAYDQFYAEYGLGTLCMGDGIPQNIQSFDDAAKQIITNTYASIFNANMHNGTPIPFGDPKEWAAQSKVKYAWMDWKDFTENENTMVLSQALKPDHGKEY